MVKNNELLQRMKEIEESYMGRVKVKQNEIKYKQNEYRLKQTELKAK